MHYYPIHLLLFHLLFKCEYNAWDLIFLVTLKVSILNMFYNITCKSKWYVIWTLPFVYVVFSTMLSSQCVSNDVGPTLQREWGCSYNMLGRKYLYIIDEYDKYVVFLLLVHAYKYQNSSIACEILITTYTHKSTMNSSLYEFTKIDYDMALLVV